MVFIYSTQSSSRLQYILHEIFARRLGMDFHHTQDLNEFIEHPGPKINYTDNPVENSLNIRPIGLLFDQTIIEQVITVSNEKWWNKIFFHTDGDIPFDLFAASFYLLSRYEEYLSENKSDDHGRFLHTYSLAFQYGFIESPLVDVWALQLKWQLDNRYPNIGFKSPKFQFISTIDIDFAYKYPGIGLKRQFLKFGKSVIQFRWNDAFEQFLVSIGSTKDPYDTYDWIQEVCHENMVSLNYFILMNHKGKHDKNILPHHALMQNLVKKLQRYATIGLHPSYKTSKHEKQLLEEKKLLEKPLKQEVVHSRQHFLKFKLPKTFRNLIEAGIRHDYTMSYSAVCGFRASTSHPFLFFDLEKNVTTGLLLHPTIVMDVTLKNFMKLTAKQSMEKIEQLMNATKKVNGTFISLWHNSNLGDYNGWKEWREVFEKMHTLASLKQHKEID